MAEKYTAIVKKNTYDPELKQDCVECYCAMLQSEHKDTQKEKQTNSSSGGGIENLNDEEEFEPSNQIEESVNYMCYPAKGTGGQGGSGSVLVPDEGDQVEIYKKDGSDTWYYENSSKKTEFSETEIPGMEEVNDDISEDGGFGFKIPGLPFTLPTRSSSGSSGGSSAPIEREKIKIPWMTKSGQSLSFSEIAGSITTILKNQSMHLKLFSGKFVELVTSNAGASANGFRASMGKVEIFNGSGTPVFSSTASDLVIEISNDAKIVSSTVTIEASGAISITAGAVNINNCDVTVTGDVIADGISLKNHVHKDTKPNVGTISGKPQ